MLCQDWPGPRRWRGKEIARDHYYSADDLGTGARVAGMITWLYSSFSAGTLDLDEHVVQKSEQEVVPRPFVAHLPQRLLSHPGGGALAVVGWLRQVMIGSPQSQAADILLAVFESALRRLLAGQRLGHVVELFNETWAEYSTTLADLLEDVEFGAEPDAAKLGEMWLVNQVASGVAVNRRPCGTPGRGVGPAAAAG